MLFHSIQFRPDGDCERSTQVFNAKHKTEQQRKRNRDIGQGIRTRLQSFAKHIGGGWPQDVWPCVDLFGQLLLSWLSNASVAKCG